jgi:hypothetical protein
MLLSPHQTHEKAKIKGKLVLAMECTAIASARSSHVARCAIAVICEYSIGTVALLEAFRRQPYAVVHFSARVDRWQRTAQRKGFAHRRLGCNGL